MTDELNTHHDDFIILKARTAVKRELEKKALLEQPVARYDPKTGNVWMEMPDGSKSPVRRPVEQEGGNG